MSKQNVEMVTDLLGNLIDWNEKYIEVIVHAIERYDKEGAQKTIRKFLSSKTANHFRSTNPTSRVLWVHSLLKTFIAGHAVAANGPKVSWTEALDQKSVFCAWMTFTHSGWATSHRAIQFDLEQAKQKVRNALAGLSFLGCFEAAVYNNEYFGEGAKRGKLVSFHCHVLVWATTESQLKRRRKDVVNRFKPLFGARSGIRIDRMKSEADLHRTLRYQSKMPLLGKCNVPTAKGGKTSKPVQLSGRTHFYLFEAFKDYSLFDLWLAGGEGARILSEAKSKLDLHYHNQWRLKRTRGKKLYPIITSKSPPRRKF